MRRLQGMVLVGILVTSFGSPLVAQAANGQSRALAEACKKGQLDVVTKLVGEGVDIESAKDEYEVSALNLAVESGSLEVVKYLLDHDPAVNRQTLSELLYNSAEVEWVFTEGPASEYRELRSHVRKASLPIVVLLVEKGADINYLGATGTVSVLDAAAYSRSLEVIDYLLSKGAKVTPSLVGTAARSGDLEAVKFLADRKMNLKTTDEGGVTALMYAAESGSLPTVKFLLSKGLPLKGNDKRGYSVLAWACRSGVLEVVRFFVEKGLPVNVRGDQTLSPLDGAVISGDLETVKYLVSKGAKYKDEEGKVWTLAYQEDWGDEWKPIFEYLMSLP